MKPTLHILTGPTAVGKTDLALRWALGNNAEIVSCDALQIYKGMDIGTAKPSMSQRRGIPHHCIDLRNPDGPFSVKDYRQAALAAVTDIFSRGKNALVTGGSGFYLKCFYAPVADEIAVPPSVAEEVLRIEREHGIGGLVRVLQTLNPQGLGALDTRNPRRVESALRRCMASGKTLFQMRAEFEKLTSPFDAFTRKTILLTRSPDSLKHRARARAETMLEAGLIDEVRALSERLKRNQAAATAIGYRETLEWLAASPPPPLSALADRITQNTCGLLRKQRTWFRHQLHPDGIIDLDVATPDPRTLFDF